MCFSIMIRVTQHVEGLGYVMRLFVKEKKIYLTLKIYR